MKQKITKAKKARRLNNWGEYQKDFFSTPVFWRRVRGFFGGDSKEFDRKHPGLSGAVDGMISRINQQEAILGMHRKV